MQPKSYTVFKWAVYALATLLFFALQGLVLDHVRVWGLTPFLYPILPAVEAMYEGPRRGPVFALVMGLFCDILIWGPFEGFYALSFTIIALISAVIGEKPSWSFRGMAWLPLWKAGKAVRFQKIWKRWKRKMRLSKKRSHKLIHP